MSMPPAFKGASATTTGLSGNEMYCLHLKGFKPGGLAVGNSVVSLGVAGGIMSGLQTLVGGEVEEVTHMIYEGRERSYARLVGEAQKMGATGVTGVSSELILHPGNIEFLSIGSAIHANSPGMRGFSTSANGQALYCQLDCGFEPRKFVFGNVAYSVGVGGGIVGMFRSLKRGEVTEFTEIFQETRQLALKRISDQATRAGANAVLGIETSILPFMGMQEMVMLGTASHHPKLEGLPGGPITSDMTNEEMWNIVKLGYVPLHLVMGVSVYSLGIVGGIASAFRSLVRGEITALTELIYEAREKAIERIHQQAAQMGADSVVGTKTYVYQMGGGLLEFLAIGTAIKKMDGFAPQTPDLPPQAVIVDRETFINTADGEASELNGGARAGRGTLIRGSQFTGALVVLGVIITFIVRVVLQMR